jgi:hypothetical protein
MQNTGNSGIHRQFYGPSKNPQRLSMVSGRGSTSAMEDTPERVSDTPVSRRKLRKWIFPTLWLLLVTWFVRRAFAYNRYAKAAAANLANMTFSSIMQYNSSAAQDNFELEPRDRLANVNTRIRAPVIIETRRSGNIVPLILHFSAVLGPTWPVITYTDAENFGSFSTSAALVRHQRSGRIVVRALSQGVYFPNWDSVPNFLTFR